MIVFDVTNEESYADLSKWMEPVKQVCKACQVLSTTLYVFAECFLISFTIP